MPHARFICWLCSFCGPRAQKWHHLYWKHEICVTSLFFTCICVRGFIFVAEAAAPHWLPVTSQRSFGSQLFRRHFARAREFKCSQEVPSELRVVYFFCCHFLQVIEIYGQTVEWLRLLGRRRVLSYWKAFHICRTAFMAYNSSSYYSFYF